MADATGLVEKIKRAALEAQESTKPVNVLFGIVQSVNPLIIDVEQKMKLGEAQLVLARTVTDHSLVVTVDWLTESGLGIHSHTVSGTDSDGDDISLTTGGCNLIHDHKIAGKKSVIIHNALKVGEEVILIRKQGGQQFIVIDRIGGVK